jgi:superfamily II DNA helicase RecQ
MFVLRKYPCQIVLLSGTVPPIAIPKFQTLFGLCSNAVEVRTDTCRREIKYEIGRGSNTTSEMIVLLKAKLAILRPTWTPKDRFLIYVQTIKDGQEVAHALQIPLYHSTSEAMGRELTTVQQEDMYNAWLSGDAVGLVTTSVLSAGNDYSHIRWVAHVGNPRDMLSFQQESGRAGRDGKAALSSILPQKKIWNIRAPPESLDLTGINAVRKMIACLMHQGPNANTCIKFHLTEFTDGVGRCCSEFQENQECNGCIAGKQYYCPTIRAKMSYNRSA